MTVGGAEGRSIARSDVAGVEVKVFDTRAEIVGDTVFKAAAGRPRAVGSVVLVGPMPATFKVDLSSPAAPPAVAVNEETVEGEA